ncbi:MAG: DUF4159 domain-containing protein [Burkholderiales bacterium]|nr:DUF4159 domain-containing protein [Phycisphaerae bacterium]
MDFLNRYRLLPCALVCALAALACQTSANAASPAQVNEAIKKGVAFLYDKRNESGNWETTQVSSGGDDNQWGGRTALCTYALLAAGEKPLDPRIVKATDWLRKAKITGHYALGMRANVWLMLPDTDENTDAMTRDRQLLTSGISDSGANKGFYDYYRHGTRIDLSCSQYGVLGAWAAAQKAAAINTGYWKNVELAWRAKQSPEGGWSYEGNPDNLTIQMTAAGVATLFITQEFLHSDDGIDGTRGNIVDPFLARGLGWVEQNYKKLLTDDDPSRMYAFYGIERIGVASGYKYFGNIDWYQSGADTIVNSMRPSGGWQGSWIGSGEENTAFALLFLSRGRAPVMMNKLQYSLTIPGTETSREANWNQRPRDVASATRWVSEKIERPLNWQIVNLNVANIDDLHDSSILYMSGNQMLSFTDAQKALLKQYIEEGGLIIGSADNGKPDFANAFRELGKEFFPGYAFAAVQDTTDLPLLSGQMFSNANWKRKPKIEALGNRARLFMVLIPEADFGRGLQKRDARVAEPFEFFANAFLYSVDKVEARFKGETHVVRPDKAIEAGSPVKVARLKYAGKWDPEPGGWKHLAAAMHNGPERVDLDVQNVDLVSGSLEGYQVAHFTGTDKFTLNHAERTAIKAFVLGGGLLIIDACGGFGDFNASVEAELSQIFPEEVSQIADPLPRSHPIYHEGTIPKPEPKYRVFAMQKMGADATRFRLRGLSVGGRLGVVYSAEDLSVGLVGMPVDGILGYEPEVASLLVRRIVTLRAAKKI